MQNITNALKTGLSNNGMSILELSRVSGIPKSTTYRLVNGSGVNLFEKTVVLLRCLGYDVKIEPVGSYEKNKTHPED